MREMLRAVQQKTPIDAQRVADLQFDLELAIVQKNARAGGSCAAAGPAAGRSTSTPARAGERRIAGASSSVRIRSCSCTVTIRCACCASWPSSAISPSSVDGQDAAALRELDPESCYLAWDLTVDTDATREVIEQVFDWAEGDCELKITRREAPWRAPAVAEAPAAVPRGRLNVQLPRPAPRAGAVD